jgi:hypothetical protein
VMESTKKLNFFPNRHGVSKHYRPRMILHQDNLDYDCHCKYILGEYVQAHDKPSPSNTNAARLLDCIYLRPTDNAQGGHELLHLQTNQVVKRRNLTPAVITPTIIKMVHRLAEMGEMPKGLKIRSRTNQILFDAAWIAGVDYEEELFDDEDFETNKDEDEDEEEEDDYDQYDKMNVNELADITDEPHRMKVQFNVPNPTNETNEPPIFQNEEEEIVFEDEDGQQQEVEEVTDEDDSEEEYDASDEEDISLEADEEEETNPNLR